MPKSPKTLFMLQALRALASCLVMVHAINYAEYRLTGSVNPFLRGGRLGEMGVDLFFVLSGYLMVVTTQKLQGTLHDLGQFFSARLLRIFPTYWTVAALWAILIALWPALELGRLYSGPVQSFFLLPLPSQNPPPLSHCWSLIFEVLYYAAIGLSLLLPARLRGWALGLWGLVILGSYGLTREGLAPLSRFLSNGLILEFLLGALIAHLGQTLSNHGLKILGLGGALMLGGEIALSLNFPEGPPSELWRVGLVGLPAALVLMGAVRLEERFGAKIPAPILAIGDRSYALYLVAPCCAAFVGVPLHSLGLLADNLMGQAGFVVMSLIVCALVTIVTYEGVEKPCLRLIQIVKRGELRIFAAKTA